MSSFTLNTYTPGPWRYDDGEIVAPGQAVVARVYDADDFPCADPETVEEWDRAAVEFRGNAALIAAAPDLLEALLAIVERFDRQVGSSALWRQARAALAKATGGQA